MEQHIINESILYPMENREELIALSAQLQAEFRPSNEAEMEIFDRLVTASWLRKRYEKVRAKLYDRKHALAAGSPQLPITIDSIRRFQQEVDQQKKQLATLRKLLRRLREGESFSIEETLHEYLPAA
ncbi:MAG: hypothetical protein FJW36_05710 [Acidobacteria bacterium]|nr:hypothetical protein [Acidobacteriota bacterium]